MLCGPACYVLAEITWARSQPIRNDATHVNFPFVAGALVPLFRDYTYKQGPNLDRREPSSHDISDGTGRLLGPFLVHYLPIETCSWYFRIVGDLVYHMTTKAWKVCVIPEVNFIHPMNCAHVISDLSHWPSAIRSQNKVWKEREILEIIVRNKHQQINSTGVTILQIDNTVQI